MRYYIQDTRQFVGNSALWWGKNASGYTTDITKAGRYTEKQARGICMNRSTDVAYPVEYINRIVSQHVDGQKLDTHKAVRFK